MEVQQQRQIEEHLARKGYSAADQIDLEVRVDPAKVKLNSIVAAFQVNGSVGGHRRRVVYQPTRGRARDHFRL